VSTSTGRKLEVLPKIVELSNLVTSDKAEYPQELQPRQRGARKALDQQVVDIAKNLDPARLGDFAEADLDAKMTALHGSLERFLEALEFLFGNFPALVTRQPKRHGPARWNIERADRKPAVWIGKCRDRHSADVPKQLVSTKWCHC
jgi:hypothetical protein